MIMLKAFLATVIVLAFSYRMVRRVSKQRQENFTKEFSEMPTENRGLLIGAAVGMSAVEAACVAVMVWALTT